MAKIIRLLILTLAQSLIHLLLQFKDKLRVKLAQSLTNVNKIKIHMYLILIETVSHSLRNNALKGFKMF